MSKNTKSESVEQVSIFPQKPAERAEIPNVSRMSRAIPLAAKESPADPTSMKYQDQDIALIELESVEIVGEGDVPPPPVQEVPPPEVQDKEEVKEKVQPPGETPDSSDKGEFSMPDKFKGKSVEEVIASYQELERHATKLAQNKASTESVQAKAPLAEEKPVVVPEGLQDLLFEDPEEAVKTIVRTVTEQVNSKVSKERAQEEDMAATRKFINKEYPHFANEPDLARILDGLASTTQGDSYMEVYKKSAELLTSIQASSMQKGKDTAKEDRQNLSEERSKAAIPTGSGTNGSKGKKYLQSEVDRLILSDPAGYDAIKSDYLDAVREGRVVRNV